jgi:hypothetical protein
MPGVDSEMDRQVLKCLREFYPIKVDEIVLVSSVQKSLKGATVDDIKASLKYLKEGALIEESSVKAPFGKTETLRYKITSEGIDRLQSLEEKVAAKGISAKDVESRIVETYDRIRADMEEMRLSIETSQKALDADMEDVRQRIAEHDQVIKTYFLRVIETFGVFVSIFAVVVVMMISIGQNIAVIKDPVILTIFLVGVPLAMILFAATLLIGIRKFILE